MYRGFFLNLDRSRDRHDTIARNIQEAGLSAVYQRFPAVDGRTLGSQYQSQLDPGNLGLWLSHEQLVSQNLASDSHLHILEDDAVLPADAAKWFPIYLHSTLETWDLLFTEALLSPLDLSLLKFFSKSREEFASGRGKLRSLKGIEFSGTSSLFINKASIGKYLNLISGQWKQGLPLDIFLRLAISGGTLQAYVTAPFLTTISRHSEVSNIKARSRSSIILDIYRRGLYKDADIPALNREMQQHLKDVKNSPLNALFVQTTHFLLSDEFHTIY